MGLDVYVGSLTRYYAGEWELRAQVVARELGATINVVRRHDPPDAVRDPDKIRPVVLAWRDGLTSGLGDHLTAPLDWDESPAAPYFSDKPTWDCYADLVMWAAYDEQSQLSRPHVHVEDWSSDPAYQASAADGFPSRYSHLYDVELWLPCPFAFVFQSEDVSGNPLTIGSSVSLQRQLEDLNQRTWQANADTLKQWAFDNSDYGAPLENGARFAFSVFLELARQSVQHKLPMRLDW